MAETKHTQGPWRARLNASTAAFPGHIIEAATGAHAPVALLWEGDGTKGKPRQVANAHLIAAAPELLEALRFVLANAFEAKWPGDERALDLVEAAIAKAEGQP